MSTKLQLKRNFLYHWISDFDFCFSHLTDSQNIIEINLLLTLLLNKTDEKDVVALRYPWIIHNTKKPGCKSISFCRQFHLHLAIKNYNAPTPHLLQKSATSLSRSMLCSHLSITVSIPNGDNFHSNCNLSCHKWWYLNVRNKIKVQL